MPGLVYKIETEADLKGLKSVSEALMVQIAEIKAAGGEASVYEEKLKQIAEAISSFKGGATGSSLAGAGLATDTEQIRQASAAKAAYVVETNKQYEAALRLRQQYIAEIQALRDLNLAEENGSERKEEINNQKNETIYKLRGLTASIEEYIQRVNQSVEAEAKAVASNVTYNITTQEQYEAVKRLETALKAEITALQAASESENLSANERKSASEALAGVKFQLDGVTASLEAANLAALRTAQTDEALAQAEAAMTAGQTKAAAAAEAEAQALRDEADAQIAAYTQLSEGTTKMAALAVETEKGTKMFGGMQGAAFQLRAALSPLASDLFPGLSRVIGSQLVFGFSAAITAILAGAEAIRVYVDENKKIEDEARKAPTWAKGFADALQSQSDALTKATLEAHEYLRSLQAIDGALPSITERYKQLEEARSGPGKSQSVVEDARKNVEIAKAKAGMTDEVALTEKLVEIEERYAAAKREREVEDAKARMVRMADELAEAQITEANVKSEIEAAAAESGTASGRADKTRKELEDATRDKEEADKRIQQLQDQLNNVGFAERFTRAGRYHIQQLQDELAQEQDISTQAGIYQNRLRGRLPDQEDEAEAAKQKLEELQRQGRDAAETARNLEQNYSRETAEVQRQVDTAVIDERERQITDLYNLESELRKKGTAEALADAQTFHDKAVSLENQPLPSVQLFPGPPSQVSVQPPPQLNQFGFLTTANRINRYGFTEGAWNQLTEGEKQNEIYQTDVLGRQPKTPPTTPQTSGVLSPIQLPLDFSKSISDMGQQAITAISASGNATLSTLQAVIAAHNNLATQVQNIQAQLTNLHR